MEQKRTLWIVSAVGVFLLVVVGAALIMYSPSVNSGSGQKTPSVASSRGPSFSQYGNQFDKNDGQLPNSGNFGMVPPPAFGKDMPKGDGFSGDTKNLTAESVNVYTNTANLYGKDGQPLDLNALKNPYSDGEKPMNVKQETTINVLPSSSNTNSSAVASAPNPPAPKPAPKVEPKPAPKPVVAVKPAPKPAAKSAPSKPATKAVAKPAPKEPDSFWIQIASYELKKNADEARRALESKKIHADVFTYEKSGKLYYRVRVGPYTTKSEAQYWKNEIASSAPFDTSKSYIVNEAG